METSRSASTPRARRLELVVGEVATGGGCVARTEDGQVVFVRHALPGERVVAQVTSESASFLRADAIEILTASPARVEPPCPFAGPGRCGGCDFQHVELGAQRRLKAGIVAGQLRHLAGIDVQVEVEAVPGAADGLGWRTRVRFATRRDGRLGFRAHRSHDVIAVDRCLVASPLVEEIGVEHKRWRGAKEVEVFVPGEAPKRPARTELDPDPTPPAGVIAITSARRDAVVSPPPLDRRRLGVVYGQKTLREPRRLHVEVGGYRYRVSAGAFWQVHVGAAPLLLQTVVQALAPRAGERVLDLYAGVGLYSLPLANAVGPTGRVTAVERSAISSADLRHNSAHRSQIEVLAHAVSRALLEAVAEADLVVLDPPREGAGVEVMAALLTLGARAIAYVACDPASFARDLKVALEHGWSLASLRAFDQFPMTEHVELVALLEPPGAAQLASGPADAQRQLTS